MFGMVKVMSSRFGGGLPHKWVSVAEFSRVLPNGCCRSKFACARCGRVQFSPFEGRGSGCHFTTVSNADFPQEPSSQ
jgi:hypothetical protein